MLIARLLYLMNQQMVFEQYKIWQREKTDASRIYHNIFNYIDNTNLYHNINICHKKVDQSLSLFANMEIRTLMIFEHVYYILWHSQTNVILKSYYNNYKITYDEVHYNIIIQSDI